MLPGGVLLSGIIITSTLANPRMSKGSRLKNRDTDGSGVIIFIIVTFLYQFIVIQYV
jgi:hypothetical protein